jgi:hypothetical protein
LADVPENEDAGAEIYGMAVRAWRNRGGDMEAFNRAYEKLGLSPDPELTGEPLDEAELRRRFPRLMARYLDEE